MMTKTLARMNEVEVNAISAIMADSGLSESVCYIDVRYVYMYCQGCSPHVFYHQIRPYVAGWSGNPSLPNGVW